METITMDWVDLRDFNLDQLNEKIKNKIKYYDKFNVFIVNGLFIFYKPKKFINGTNRIYRNEKIYLKTKTELLEYNIKNNKFYTIPYKEQILEYIKNNCVLD